MAEVLSIAMELRNVQRILADAKRMEDALNAVDEAASRKGFTGLAAAQSSLLIARIARLATVAGIAGTALTLMGRQVLDAAERMREFGAAQLATGGSAKQVALLEVIAQATGLGNAAGIAAQLRQNIAAGGLARSAASQAGIGTVLPAGFGPANEADIFLKAAQQVRQAQSDLEAVNIADMYGVRELVQVRQLSEQAWASVRRMAEAEAALRGPEAIARAREFSLWWQEQVQSFRHGLGFIGDWVLKLAGFTGQGGSPQADALRQNTQALNQNTVAISNMRNVFGGGERARGAIPAGFRYEVLQRQMEGEALKGLGAFRL